VTDSRRGGAVAVAAAAILWSTGGLAIKTLSLPPLAIVFHRAWIASAALLLFLRPARVPLTRTFAAGIASYAGMIVTFVVATKWTTAANAIFLQDSGVLWVLLLSPLVTREPIARRDVQAVAVALAGIALFFFGRISARGQAGNLVGLLSGMFFAVTILLLRRQRGPASQWTAILGNALAAAAVTPFLRGIGSASGREWAILAYLGLVQIALAYALFIRGLNSITATEASLLSLLEPVFNPIWVLIGAGERPGPFAVAGGAVVIGAILWRTLSSGPREPEPIPTPD
jgi:DME family drug/metabolite transporter